MHVSLDGFVAGPQGEMDWIKVDQDLFDYVGKRIGEGDISMYGRVTYQMMESYWPTAANKPNATKHDIQHSTWYAGVHKIVLSDTMKQDSDQVTVIGHDDMDRIQLMKEKGSKEILLFGSPGATHSLMQRHLIDGFWLFLNPVILGCGIPLFKDVQQKVNLKLLHSKPLNNGVIELNYDVETSPQ